MQICHLAPETVETELPDTLPLSRPLRLNNWLIVAAIKFHLHLVWAVPLRPDDRLGHSCPVQSKLTYLHFQVSPLHLLELAMPKPHLPSLP